MSNKLDTANAVLATFAAESRIERRQDGYYVVWTTHGGKPIAKRWICRGQDFYPMWANRWGHGGTACTALSQLIRWLQGKPVLPLATWAYWSCDKVKLVPYSSVAVLLAAGYPEVAQCVLCDRPLNGSLDWWHLGDVSGPCCSHRDGCRQGATGAVA